MYDDEWLDITQFKDRLRKLMDKENRMRYEISVHEEVATSEGLLAMDPEEVYKQREPQGYRTFMKQGTFRFGKELIGKKVVFFAVLDKPTKSKKDFVLTQS